MIVIDTSALISILTREPDHQRYLKLMDAVERRLVSAVTLYETGIVMLARAGAEGVNDLNDLLQEISAEIIPFDHAQATAALAAYGRYGKASIRTRGSTSATALPTLWPRG